MDIDAAMTRNVQDRLRQQQAIGGDNCRIGLQGGKNVARHRILEMRRRMDGQAEHFGPHVHRRRCEAAAICRPRRLAVNSDDFVTGIDKRIECDTGEVGGSHKDKAHAKTVSQLRRKTKVADEIEQLTALMARLPGLGPRSARRVVLHMLKNREKVMQPLAMALERADRALATCPLCGNLDIVSPCRICSDPRRDAGLLCVVADVSDIWALERGRMFSGRYHVLGGMLSALDGIGPEDLTTNALVARVQEEKMREVVLAMNATLEGQTTAHYVARLLAPSGVEISQLAHGVPVGGELDYLDEGTLAQALRLRRPLAPM